MSIFLHRLSACACLLLSTLWLFAGVASATTLDDLMQSKTSSSKKSDNKSDKAKDKRVSLGDLMSSEKKKSQPPTSQKGSLLGNVEGDRYARKKGAAWQAYVNVRHELSDFCGCLVRGDCEFQWSSKSWDKSSSFLQREKRAIRQTREACDKAPAAALEEKSSSLDEINEHTLLANNSNNQLQRIEKGMRSAGVSDRMDQYYREKQVKKDKIKAIADAKRRKFNEQTARMNAEVERAWKRDANKRDTSWDQIEQIQRQTMSDIHRAQRGSHQQASNSSYQQSNPATSSDSRSSTGNKEESTSDNSSQRSSSKSKSSKSSVTGYRYITVPSGSSSSNKGSSNKGIKEKSKNRLVFYAVREESEFSWPTQEKACKYGKAKAMSVAKKRCKEKYKGVTATTSDVPIPVDINCQSYRQMTADGFSSTKGQWKATGNVSFYCRLPN